MCRFFLSSNSIVSRIQEKQNTEGTMKKHGFFQWCAFYKGCQIS